MMLLSQLVQQHLGKIQQLRRDVKFYEDMAILLKRMERLSIKDDPHRY
jgi:hypothetical protein